MIHAGLTLVDGQGVRRPQLAEQVPSTENDLWRVFPDGRMETIWRIREGARWHDGTPFTSHDMVFTATVTQDRELAVFRDQRYDAIESFAAPDDRTFTVRWRRPHIEAADVFAFLFEALGMRLPDRR